RFPAGVVLDARGGGLVHVSSEPVEALLIRQLRLASVLQLLAAPLLGGEGLFVLLLFRFRRRALEGTSLLAFRVKEREGDFSLGFVAQPVRDEHAVWWVLAGVDVDLSLLAGRLLD